MIILCNLLIMLAMDAFEVLDKLPDLYNRHAPALIVSFLTPVTFWIPLLAVAKWAWNRSIAICFAWGASIWMITVHLFKLITLLDIDYISTEHTLVGITVFLIGGLGIGAVVWKLVVERKIQRRLRNGSNNNEVVRQPPMRPRLVGIKCPSCRETFKKTVLKPEDIVVCPKCGAGKFLYEMEKSIKEPITCQIARAICCTAGWLALLGGIGLLVCYGVSQFQDQTYPYPRRNYELSLAINLLIVLPVNLAFWFGVQSGIRKGANWTRYLMSVICGFILFSAYMSGIRLISYLAVLWGLVTALLFFSSSNTWFAVKTMLRKRERPENQ